MSSGLSPWIEVPPGVFSEAGVYAYGVSEVSPVSPEDMRLYDNWISSGCNGGMQYMERYPDVRRDPALLLDGARSVISCAFAYRSSETHPGIASYALGRDYHEVLRERLENVAAALRSISGAETRVCVDTAPLRERYWAVKSGLGFTGLNGHLIIPGAGSYFFLGEIVTTARIKPSEQRYVPMECGRCRKCINACPAGALHGDGTVDARRCLSYLTIEHRGEFDSGTRLHGRLYGCDICGEVCPHNSSPVRCVIDGLKPRPAVMAVTVRSAAQMSRQEFSEVFSHSAIKRTKLDGLRRNALHIIDEETHYRRE